MPKRKHKKPKHPGGAQVDLVKLGEERLERGQAAEAIRHLLRAEAEAGRGPSPPLAGQPAVIARLLARAFFARAVAGDNLSQQIADLEEALKRAPTEVRYLLTLGLCRLRQGRTEMAFEQFRLAREIAPDDQHVRRALALGLLITGRTHDAGELLETSSEEGDHDHFRRLSAIRALIAESGDRGEDRSAKHEAANCRANLSPPVPHPSSLLIDSLSLLAVGEVERARAQLSELPALDRNPSGVEAAVLATQLFYSGALSFQAHQFKEAAADLREAQRLAHAHATHLPWLSRLAAYFHRIAERAVSSHDLNFALECWRRELEIDPGDQAAAADLDAARRVQANQAWRAGQAEQAVKLWQEGLASNPQDEQLLKNLAVGCEQLGRKPEAIRYWSALAQRWRQQAKRQAAETQFTERLLQLEQRLVNLMMETGIPGQEILNELESALKFDPDNDEFRRRAVDLLLEFGRPQPALKHLEIIERRQGESADLLAQKGLTLDLLRQREPARKAFERALELAPLHPAARHGYLTLLDKEAEKAERKGQISNAMEICQRQLSLDPLYGPAVSRLASAYFLLGRKKDAKESLKRFIGTGALTPQKHVIVGAIYLSHGLTREANLEFKHAAELEPSAVCHLHIGLSYLEYGKLKQALKHFDIAAQTGSFEVLMQMFAALLESEQQDEAGRYLEQAMRLNPEHPAPHLAKAISALSNPLALVFNPRAMEEAKRELDEAERLASEHQQFQELLVEIREIRRLLQRAPGIASLDQVLRELGGTDEPLLDELEPAPKVRRRRLR